MQNVASGATQDTEIRNELFVLQPDMEFARGERGLESFSSVFFAFSSPRPFLAGQGTFTPCGG